MRVVLVQLLPKTLGWRRFAIAYGCLIALVGICLLVVNLSEMPLYGFDNSNPRHMAGYRAMWLGVLVAVGIPIVVFLDMVMALLKRRLRR